MICSVRRYAYVDLTMCWGHKEPKRIRGYLHLIAITSPKHILAIGRGLKHSVVYAGGFVCSVCAYEVGDYESFEDLKGHCYLDSCVLHMLRIYFVDE